MLEAISKRKLKLCLGDFILIALLQIPAFLTIVGKGYFSDFSQKYFWVFFLIPVIWILILFISRAYEVIEETKDKISDANTFIKATVISVITLGFIFYLLTPLVDFPQRVLLVHGFLVIIVLWLWRIVFGKIIHRPEALKRVLILGTGRPSQEIAREIVSRPNQGYKLIGFIESKRRKRTNDYDNIYESKYEYEIDEKFILGNEIDIIKVIDKNKIDLVVSALPEEKSRRMVLNILEIQQRGISVIEMPNFYEELTGKISIQHLGPSWIILGQFKESTKIQEISEFLLNSFFALLLLILSLPLAGIIALAIKLEDKGPIFYRQKRVGKRGKVFTFIKFRNMKPEAEKETGPIWAQKDDKRITKTGKFLRKWRLDEIPQLINILLGQMVFVGPRPERPEFVKYLEKEIPFYKMRHLIKPGLTGWAQVRFKYGASLEDALQKLQYELYYIKHRSLLFDLIILLKTVEVVITGRGAQ
jgi:sugar transferase (PEP-CTERM system associated)